LTGSAPACGEASSPASGLLGSGDVTPHAVQRALGAIGEWDCTTDLSAATIATCKASGGRRLEASG